MRRHDVPAGEHVDGEQAVVGDHDVGLAGTGPRRLGEAFRSVRAPGGTDALAGGHRHLPPRSVVDARVEFVAVAGLGLRGPVPQPLDLLAEASGLAEPHRLGFAPPPVSKRASSGSSSFELSNLARHR